MLGKKFVQIFLFNALKEQSSTITLVLGSELSAEYIKIWTLMPEKVISSYINKSCVNKVVLSISNK